MPFLWMKNEKSIDEAKTNEVEKRSLTIQKLLQSSECLFLRAR